MRATILKTPSTVAAPYWGKLRKLSTPIKLELMALLSNSLAYNDDEESDGEELTEEERKAGIMSLAGCWSDDPEDAALMEDAIKSFHF